MDLIMALKPKSVLDIGAGYGKYGVLCREYLELWDGRQNYYERLRRIDGVEVFENYITPLHKYVYDHIYIGDIIKLVSQIDFKYDLVLLIDVLEHFSKLEGESLMTKLLEKNIGILISTPRKPTVQKEAFGNVYESHRSRWRKQELARFGNSYFINDPVSFIGYISQKEHIQKLKSELILMKIKKSSEVSSLISSWKYYTNKYIKQKVPDSLIKWNERAD
ncbi:MAG: hypothetical protein DLM72_15810 [Candidatus Nitrosopolaris wilkensis]|nr:MAG: hypothetical protein DLM72_15810 [Candidatus Nitrosopolaris wilkensis]